MEDSERSNRQCHTFSVIIVITAPHSISSLSGKSSHFDHIKNTLFITANCDENALSHFDVVLGLITFHCDYLI
jgi:hypothetical protein